jgi:hypothetical protein
VNINIDCENLFTLGAIQSDRTQRLTKVKTQEIFKTRNLRIPRTEKTEFNDTLKLGTLIFNAVGKENSITKCEDNIEPLRNMGTLKELSFILDNNDHKENNISNFLDDDNVLENLDSPKWAVSKSLLDKDEVIEQRPKHQSTKKNLLSLQKYMYIFSDTNDLQVNTSTKKPMTDIYDGDMTNYKNDFRANTSHFELSN